MSPLTTISLFAVFAAIAPAAAQGNDATIRAGKNIAVTTCVGCHLVSRDQAVKPILGPGIPNFEDIANRPGMTVDVLSASMKEKRWHDPALTGTLLPMSRISDSERAQVAAYILSLRKHP